MRKGNNMTPRDKIEGLRRTVPWIALLLVTSPAAASEPDAEWEDAEWEDADDEDDIDEDAAEIIGTSETAIQPTALRTWRADRVERARLETFAGGSILDALQFQTGVRIENECSVCNSSSIRLGGLPGSHTVVLVDGVPLLGALGSVYGLLMLDASLVESVELRRGPSPASPAGAATSVGTIDLRTRRAPTDFAELRLEGGAPTLARAVAAAGIARPSHDALAAVTVDRRSALDRDGDGVTEQAGVDRMQAAWIGRQRPTSELRLHQRLQHLRETRQGGWLDGGLLDTLDSDRRALVETILTERTEVATGGAWKVSDARTVSATAAATRHAQVSDYGGEGYTATQWAAFTELRWVERAAHHLRWESGLSWRGEWLDENVGLDARRWHQPGAFVDIGWNPNRLDVSLALRTDWHNEFGVLFVPAARARIDVHRDWSVLATVGRGARTPVTFFEQFQGVRPEGYRLVYDADRAERTTTAGLSVEGNIGPRWLVGAHVQAARVEDAMAFRTDADEDGAVGEVVVFQSGAPLDVLSVEAEVTAWAWRDGEVQVAWTVTLLDDPGGALQVPTSTHQGFARWTQTIRALRSELTVRGRITGPADLEGVFGPRRLPLGRDPSVWLAEPPVPGVAFDPTVRGRTRSPWFGLLDVRWNYTARPGLDLYVGVDNVLDFHPSDIEGPLFFSGPDNDAAFDVISNWGPTRGRFAYGGIVWRM
jgi:hypothetical protein